MRIRGVLCKFFEELPRQVLDGMDEIWRKLPVGTRFAYNR